jgi:signal transduction histidine kinase
MGFAPFQRWVERRLLGIRLLPDSLVETYASRILASFNEPKLVQLLKEEILPSLLVRQSALLWLEEHTARSVYTQAVDESQLPNANEIASLLPLTGKYYPPGEALPITPVDAWVRLALALTIENRTVGVWLLGRRDPDDYYSQRGIATLQSLAQQTAMALTNIVQSERLQAFYQKDIEAHETQRTHLAHELHDHILNELAQFKTSVDKQAAPPHFFETCDNLIASLRQTIKDLRPDMLDYGLHPALITLIDKLSQRSDDGPEVSLQVTSDGTSYELNMELHIFRIVQQACENALIHAHPQTITVRGQLEADLIKLCIEDDGQGFETGAKLDLARLIAAGHFGLKGMFERAALINAQLSIDSVPGHGTRVWLTWQPKPA